MLKCVSVSLWVGWLLVVGICALTMTEYEYGSESKQRSLLIPVKNSDQAVEVFADEIPDDVNDIIDILRAEVAPLDVWLQFAVRSNKQAKKQSDILYFLLLCRLWECSRKRGGRQKGERYRLGRMLDRRGGGLASFLWSRCVA